MRGPKPLEELIAELTKLPSIGRKSAERLAYFLVRSTPKECRALADQLVHLHERLRTCSVCFSLDEQDPCRICSDPERDSSLLCVVEDFFDILSFEKAVAYRGLYHVLEGCLSPLKGIAADQLRIAELLKRVEKGRFHEVILATNPSVDGEATAVYLASQLKPYKIAVTRIGVGVPIGSTLEYADGITLRKALEGRKTF
ncbi:MAG: recombination mediator RecR [bacterium]